MPFETGGEHAKELLRHQNPASTCRDARIGFFLYHQPIQFCACKRRGGRGNRHDQRKGSSAEIRRQGIHLPANPSRGRRSDPSQYLRKLVQGAVWQIHRLCDEAVYHHRFPQSGDQAVPDRRAGRRSRSHAHRRQQQRCEEAAAGAENSGLLHRQAGWRLRRRHYQGRDGISGRPRSAG